MAGIHEVARAANITDVQARSLFAAILEFVKTDDANGKPNRLHIKGFGTFRRHRMKARTIKSPQIPGGRSDVPEQNLLRFKASPVTKPILNPPPEPKKAKAKPANGAAAAPPKKQKPAPAPASEPEGETETTSDTTE